MWFSCFKMQKLLKYIVLFNRDSLSHEIILGATGGILPWHQSFISNAADVRIWCCMFFFASVFIFLNVLNYVLYVFSLIKYLKCKIRIKKRAMELAKGNYDSVEKITWLNFLNKFETMHKTFFLKIIGIKKCYEGILMTELINDYN